LLKEEGIFEFGGGGEEAGTFFGRLPLGEGSEKGGCDGGFEWLTGLGCLVCRGGRLV
jgi:hypothetical protein